MVSHLRKKSELKAVTNYAIHRWTGKLVAKGKQASTNDDDPKGDFISGMKKRETSQS